MKDQKRIAALGLASALVLTTLGASPALAADASSAVQGDGSRAELIVAPSGQRYTDFEVIEFLTFGEGRINDEHPGLAQSLGFVEFPEDGDRDQVYALLNAYLAENGKVVSRVSSLVQSGDPLRVERGMETFAESFNGWVMDLIAEAEGEESGQGGPEVTPYAGSFYVETNVVAITEIAATAWGVVFGAVALFHAATAVTVIVYLPDYSGGGSSIERDDLTMALTRALN
ncbi:MAG: hypothetical protein ACK5MR_13790 [Cumulibacter sp.]